MALMVNAFLGWQVYLIVTNQTSIEFHNNGEISSKMKHKGNRVQFKHIYSVGILDNIKSFLGEDPAYWFLPTKFEGLDGIHFPLAPSQEIKKFQEVSIEAQLESDGEDDGDDETFFNNQDDDIKNSNAHHDYEDRV